MVNNRQCQACLSSEYCYEVKIRSPICIGCIQKKIEHKLVYALSPKFQTYVLQFEILIIKPCTDIYAM